MPAKKNLPSLRTVIGSFDVQFKYLGLRVSPKKFVLNMTAFAVLLAIASVFATLFLFAWETWMAVIGAVLVFALAVGGTYLVLDLKTESRGKAVEKILPDALQLVASNIKSGLTTERALLMSARPEFGPLEKELKRVSTKILSGMPVEKAILEIPKNIKSTLVERTMWLLARGISSGGEIADLLMQLSKNLRTQVALQNEAKAAISIYIILIFFSAAFGGPALYAVASFIVQVMNAQSGAGVTIDSEQLGAAAGQLGGVGSFLNTSSSIIDPGFVVFFSQIILFVGGIFASLILGAISSGKEKDGVKYIPFIFLFSFGLFHLIRFALSVSFGPLLLGG
jgi:archaellum biogenesis protein FlaJ (TadC family)